MGYNDLELVWEEDKTTPIKVFIYKSFICYMTITEPNNGIYKDMYYEVLDGGTTTSGYIIVRYLNINEYTHMKEVIKKIKLGKKQNKDDFFPPVPQLGRDENIKINKMEITFNSYFSFWNSTTAPRDPKKYVGEQLKEIIDMYYA